MNCIRLMWSLRRWINWLWRVKFHNQYPPHKFIKACRGRKTVCPLWIRPTEIFYHTWGKLSVSMISDPVGAKSQVNNQQSKHWLLNLKYVLYQSKQLIYVNTNEHPTSTLAMTFLKPEGGGGVCMSIFDMAHRRHSRTPQDKYQAQLNLTKSTLTKQSTVDNVLIKTKTPN